MFIHNHGDDYFLVLVDTEVVGVRGHLSLFIPLIRSWWLDLE